MLGLMLKFASRTGIALLLLLLLLLLFLFFLLFQAFCMRPAECCRFMPLLGLGVLTAVFVVVFAFVFVFVFVGESPPLFFDFFLFAVDLRTTACISTAEYLRLVAACSAAFLICLFFSELLLTNFWIARADDRRFVLSKGMAVVNVGMGGDGDPPFSKIV